MCIIPSAKTTTRSQRVVIPFFAARLIAVALAGLWLAVGPLLSCTAGGERAWIEPQSLLPQLLPAPPAEGSEAWKAQVEMVVAAQNSLSPAEISAIRNEQKFRVELMTDTLGLLFDDGRLQKTYALLNRVERT